MLRSGARRLHLDPSGRRSRPGCCGCSGGGAGTGRGRAVGGHRGGSLAAHRGRAFGRRSHGSGARRGRRRPAARASAADRGGPRAGARSLEPYRHGWQLERPDLRRELPHPALELPALDLYRASASGCSNQDLSKVNAWDYRDGEVYLYQTGGAVAARLRGSSASLSGVLAKSGAPLTLAR
ncbi:hypothetical protein ACFQY9_00660 [Microvirga aerilata]|uniref:hypothetical protein n=1 Tax=Microvirga aerilata TaxID=670292 RepID=UPI003628CDFE